MSFFPCVMAFKAKTAAEKDTLVKRKKLHLYVVGEERFEYAQRILLAKTHPDKYLSLTIDGSDNSSYGFPYFPTITHEDSKGFKIRYVR